MRRFNPFVVAIIVSLLIVIACLVHALKQHRPYAPDIKSEQHSESAVEGERDAKGETPVAAVSDKGHASGHGEKAEEDGTEFWPSVFGLRIKITDSLLVAFTFGLTVFTGLLWKSTAGLFNVTKIVADGDRPHMIPSEMAASGFLNSAEDGIVKVGIIYKFTNYGRSPAFMKRYCIMVLVSGTELGPSPDYGPPTQNDLIVVVNAVWGSADAFPMAARLEQATVKKILEGTSKLLIVGYIEYSDTASQNHKMRFAYHLIFGEGDRSVQFLPFGPASYREYT
jgi:hypothetical protein